MPELESASPSQRVLSELKDYFARVAPLWETFRHKNTYHHAQIRSFVQSMVPPGKPVLEIGSGTGELLNALQPSQGLGLNLSEALTSSCRKAFPHLEFSTMDVDRVVVPPGFNPEFVVLTNMLDYTYDVADLLARLRSVISDHALLVITTSNPLWAGPLRLASRLGWRMPDSPRNFVTNKDIQNILHVEEFDGPGRPFGARSASYPAHCRFLEYRYS